MLCPWCGSPVMIRGSQWECGWCGDSGVLRRKPVQKPVQLTLRLSFVYHVELSEAWLDLKEALAQLAPKKDTLSQLLGKVLLHHISAGIHHAGSLPDEQKAEELRAFLNTTADLNLGERTEQIMRDAGRGILFREEAALSERQCGTFWTELFSIRPPEDYYNNVEPDGLDTLLFRLSSVYTYFGTKEDEETCDAQVYRNALQEAYYAQWQNHVLLHPDIERAKQLLSEGRFPANEDICREILLVEFPEEVPHETAEELEELSWAYILDDVFSRDTETGMTMWRFLLDIAEPALKSSPEAAGTLLRDWNWLAAPDPEQALPLLIALEDARFASQLFKSAFIGRTQLSVLKVCRACGEAALGRGCLALALKNPHLDQGWEKQLRRVFPAVFPTGHTEPPKRP